jgi:hypothetical protein
MKYIELSVPDKFDDQEMTVFDALDMGADVSDAWPVSREDLLEALQAVVRDYDTAGCEGCGVIGEVVFLRAAAMVAKAAGETQ